MLYFSPSVPLTKQATISSACSVSCANMDNWDNSNEFIQRLDFSSCGEESEDRSVTEDDSLSLSPPRNSEFQKRPESSPLPATPKRKLSEIFLSKTKAWMSPTLTSSPTVSKSWSKPETPLHIPWKKLQLCDTPHTPKVMAALWEIKTSPFQKLAVWGALGDRQLHLLLCLQVGFVLEVGNGVMAGMCTLPGKAASPPACLLSGATAFLFVSNSGSVNLRKAELCSQGSKSPVEGVANQGVLVEGSWPLITCVTVLKCDLATEPLPWENDPSPCSKCNFLKRV